MGAVGGDSSPRWRRLLTLRCVPLLLGSLDEVLL